jgi:endoglucanase
MMDEAPWTVDASWLQRVSDVIDMITSNGLYVMVNAHHDSWASFDLAAASANYTRYEEKFYSLWYQIGEKLACKSSMVAFEPLNEPTGSTVEQAAELNKLQRIFLNAINDAGGHNSKRIVVLGGLGDNAVNMVQWLQLPSSNITNPYALTFHYYSPWDFVALAWGKTTWGTDTEKAAVDADFAAVRGNYTDIPIIVGEFGLEVRATETAARWKWFDHVVRTGFKYNFTMMLWDASIHFVVDSPEPWQDPTALDIILYAARGEDNALAGSTEDGSATEQWSSANVWHRAGTLVTDQSLPFLMNENVLEWMRSTSSPLDRLRPGEDYNYDGRNVTFTKSFLSTVFQNGTSPGLKANISLQTSGGAVLQLQAVEWDTPQTAITDHVVNVTNAANDLYVPFEFKGLTKVATVKAQMYNGSLLFDDWTQWLGPLQQGRLVSPTWVPVLAAVRKC